MRGVWARVGRAVAGRTVAGGRADAERPARARGSAATGSGDVAYYPPPDLSRLGTADLADAFLGDVYDHDADRDQTPRVRALAPIPCFWDFGARPKFSGPIATVQCFENNAAVRAALSEEGRGRVLVVDTVGTPRAALVGDNLAELAIKSGWSGILLNGFLRDAACLREMPIGIKALGTYPVKSGKRAWGVRDVPVTFGGVTFRPGEFLYSDEDGVLVSDQDLQLLAPS